MSGPQSANNQANGQFDKRDLRYIAADDQKRWPAGQRDLAPDDRRARPDAAPLLVLSVSPLPEQGAPHDRTISAHRALRA